jgi:hypothetical protein
MKEWGVFFLIIAVVAYLCREPIIMLISSIRGPKIRTGEMYAGEDDQKVPEKYRGVFSVKVEHPPVDQED